MIVLSLLVCNRTFTSSRDMHRIRRVEGIRPSTYGLCDGYTRVAIGWQMGRFSGKSRVEREWNCRDCHWAEWQAQDGSG
jgi:hypothetical protein